MATTLSLAQYYANLLIFQYLGKPKAYATIQSFASQAILPQVTIQTITFSVAPTAGAFTLNYNGVSTASINYSDPVGTVQTKLRAISGLGSITVTGSIASTSLVVTFTGVAPIADLLTVTANTLLAAGQPVSITITETDVTLPFAVQNAFNIDPTLGPTAVGVQLDIIGKYAGVGRNVNTFTGPDTLTDSEFLIFIQLAVAVNNAGSSLYDIQNLLQLFFAGQIFVFDHQNMHMDYFINSGLGNQNLIEAFVTTGLLPRPMGVGLGAIIYAPIIDAFFGFRTYPAPGFNNSPFNDYASYILTWPWLSYADTIQSVGGADFMLLESGGRLLLESGGHLLLG